MEKNLMKKNLIKYLIDVRKNSTLKNQNYKTILISGNKLINEICKIKKAKNLILSNENIIPNNILIPDNVFFLNNNLIEKISGLKSHDGFLAEIEKPFLLDFFNHSFKNLIIFENLSDPGFFFQN
jgi:tRNA G18 (ribose-2'-O)-methylase SpoU